MKWKLIVFDMDGTLYDLQDVIAMNYRMQADFYSVYCGISHNETDRIFREHDIFSYTSFKSKSATEFFLRNGIPIKLWQDYRNEHFDVSWIKTDGAAENSIIQKFHADNYMVLLTSNSLCNVKKVLRHLEIMQENFDMIVCPDFNYPFSKAFNKFHAMSHIMNVFSVKPEECLSIGDRYETDIAPMIKLGGAGVLVKKPSALYDIYNYIKGKTHTCDDSFVFYCYGSCKRNLWEDIEV